ncbi:MAG: hypothetical protein U1E27_08825, partial [Kiritimatiellia bacterium]|nr:hypothetical protein [Kiritimatiellia bacterium]
MHSFFRTGLSCLLTALAVNAQAFVRLDSAYRGLTQSTLALDGSVLTNTLSGSLVPAHSFARAYNGVGESTGWTLTEGGIQRNYAISRNGAGRVLGVSDAGLSAAYTPAVGAPGVGLVNLGAIRAEYVWGAGGTQLSNLVWKTSSDTTLASFEQTYDENEPTRVVRRARLDGSAWNYLYDEHGRLINAALRDAGGQLLPGGLYGYSYDEAGNPVTGGPVVGTDPIWAFETAGHLQVRRIWGNQVEILGEAAADATVGVSL